LQNKWQSGKIGEIIELRKQTQLLRGKSVQSKEGLNFRSLLRDLFKHFPLIPISSALKCD